MEKLRDLIRIPIRLPRPLIFQTMSCKGVANAWYHKDTVTVCYELVDNIWKSASEKATPAGIAPIDTMVGPFVFVFLHEVGHALFDMLSMPVLGRARRTLPISSRPIFMLQFEKDEARRLIAGSAYQYRAEVQADTVTMGQQAFADEHGIAAQRFYNLLCMAYGADPELFGDLVTQDYLPGRRVPGGVGREYVQVANAFATLLGPHIDLKLGAAQPKRWLAPVDSRPSRYRSP